MEKRIIEINGVKLEVDLREAKTVESYKVGDQIKVLIKSYSDTFNSYFGTIVGFDNFESRPTIIIAYLEVNYDGAELKIIYFNKDSKDVEVCPADNGDFSFTKSSVVDSFQKQIAKKEMEKLELEQKLEYFLTRFGKYFENK